jgi:hypothetical protein
MISRLRRVVTRYGKEPHLSKLRLAVEKQTSKDYGVSAYNHLDAFDKCERYCGHVVNQEEDV